MELNEAPVMGRIGPFPDGRDAPYWEALAQGTVKLQQCESCRSWIWGAAWRCAECGSWDIAWRAVEPRGVVYSWIRTWQAFTPEVTGKVPYVTVLAALPHAGNRRVLGMLVGPEEGLKIGAPVHGLIQKPSALTGNQAILRWTLDQS